MDRVGPRRATLAPRTWRKKGATSSRSPPAHVSGRWVVSLECLLPVGYYLAVTTRRAIIPPFSRPHAEWMNEGESERITTVNMSAGVTPLRLARIHGWWGTLVVLAGATLGVFLSRVLAEAPWMPWPFHHPWLVAGCALIGGGVAVVTWQSLARRRGWNAQAAASLLPLLLLLTYITSPEPRPLQAAATFGGAVLLVILLSLPGVLHDRWVALALFALALAGYLFTLTPAVGSRDGYELQAISATLGFAHPTGYPLFPLIGRLWLLLFPLGSVAWRINVLCALFAATGIPLVYLTVRRVLGKASFAAWSALILAFSRTLWTQASQPEKYTLNALFVALILYLAFGRVDPEGRGAYPHLRLLAFAYGLSLTHHRTMLMLAPSLLLYVLWRDPSLLRRPKEWLSALGYALAPLLIYLYIPWRAYAQGWAMTPGEFVRYISGAYYGPAVRLGDFLAPERAGMFWRFTVAQFGHVGVALGLLGLIGLAWRRRWRFLACTALAYVAYYFWGTVWYAYYNDVNSFIPNHMLLAMWIGSGAMLLFRALLSAANRFDGRIVRALFWSVLSLMPVWLVWHNAPLVDRSGEWGMTRLGEYTIALDIPQNAVILADREKHPPLDYFARIERRRPDVEVVILGDEKAYRDRLLWELAHGRRVYLARFLPGLEGSYHLRSLGPLVEVGTEPLTTTGHLEGSPVVFGEGIRLLGYTADRDGEAVAGDRWPITLFWQALSPVSTNYLVRMRLVGASGHVWLESSGHPVSGMYPTAAWKPPEVIPDWHGLSLPQALPPGNYRVEVGLFLPFSSEGLTTADGQPWSILCDIHVSPPKRPFEMEHHLGVIAPQKWRLLGYDLPRRLPPGGRATLTLYWRPLTRLPDYEIGVRVLSVDEGGEWQWARPDYGEYPSSQWPPGRVVATLHPLAMPLTTGSVTVQVAIRRADTHERVLFYPRWAARQVTRLSLPSLAVVGHPTSAPGTVNFGDRILMLGIDVEPRELTPGAQLRVTARWQCMRAMEADYTLFLHLLAPDGTIKGQADVWPRDGTYPTSRWREGDVIEDRYSFYLDREAPPGDYKLEVGWYLLETMQRLPVLDSDGRAVDDKVLLSGLTVSGQNRGVE